jgi:ubiquitin-conjugating enzyme E2 Z
MSTTISKDTIQKLLKDIKDIYKNPLTDNGIYYSHDESDMLKGYALIIGPSDTPYFSGNYFFELNFPYDYPFRPPKVTYYTNGENIRFNPNLYKCGKVCISLLNTWRGEQWTSCQSIRTILLTLCTLLCKDPLLNEPGVSKTHPDFNNYTNIIEHSNIKIAICDIVNKKAGIYIEQFDIFYVYIKENFLKNYDNLLEIIDKNISKEELKNKPILITNYYSMNVKIDYESLRNKLIECYNNLTDNGNYDTLLIMP